MHVARLLGAYAPQPQIVVVSAMQGVTDALVGLADAAATQREWLDDWAQLRQRHLDVAGQLDPSALHGLAASLHAEFDDLHARLERIAATDDVTEESTAVVHGLGEVWSSRLLQAAIGGEASGWARLDAREVLVVHPGELGVAVDWARSREQLDAWHDAHEQDNVIVTGFVARDAQGRTTTLGRNGSDYSAAIFASLFDAGELTIWTDVDGVLSADPRLVPDAVCLASMSYAEACELAYFGATVLHPQTMAPAMQAGLPIRIRNTFNPAAAGTLITQHSQPAASPVKGLSLVDRLALLELTGAGLIGVPGTAERMFAALHLAGVSVTMISQGSSEHSICCVVREDQVERARSAVESAFLEAIGDGQAQGVGVTRDICVLAAVGDGMVGTPGVAARLFAGLAQARVNIRAIAQGASERNISVAIAASDATRALRAAHTAFWLSPQTLSVGLIGPGKVGRALLAQLAEALPRFAREASTGSGSKEPAYKGLDLRLRAIADSRRMHLENKRLDPDSALEALHGATATLVLDAFAAHVRAEHLPHALIVDCSGSDAVAAHYPRWLAAGIHIATPNKHAGSGDWARYQAIRAAKQHGGHFRYEATVGAGLPVIQTLRSLLDTGDELTEIEGVLSGTLAWLFNRFDGSQPFSVLVREAHALGYTEPDPRDDLSGTDVARKLVILAREAGRSLSLADVEVESLVPESLRSISREDFMQRLHELDAPMQTRFDQARRDGRSLRYLARLEGIDNGGNGRAWVGIAMPEPGHASLHSRLTDNLIQFRTRRYADNPLVVQGPGAGPDVTAAGVFGDVLAIAQALGARL
ncbi:MAG: bifunctional aspartate kinase/homoserine dehydrogenase I [Lysobacter sp.]